jgi:cytoskeletal protein CcmA (bactofilin family)
MFGRKKLQDDDKMPDFADELAIPAKPALRPTGMTGSPLGSTLFRSPVTGAARASSAEAVKPGDPYKPMTEPQRGSTTPAPAKRDHETRKLIVGREIALSGEITSCDRLVVEGSVEANLANCRDIDIAESGLYKGSASIDEAEIRGRFEGTLNVRRRLLIRATGRVTGTVRYGQIEIECGGQISGDVQAQPMAEPAEPAGRSETISSPPRPTVVSRTEEARL